MAETIKKHSYIVVILWENGVRNGRCWKHHPRLSRITAKEAAR